MTRKTTVHIYPAIACSIAIASILCGGVALAESPDGEAAPTEETTAPAQEAAATEEGAVEYEEEAADPVQPGVAMLGYTDEAAYYWPRWRGPSGQGIVSDDYDYPHQWSAGENVLWKVEVPGGDSASPIVWGDKIFLVTTDTRGDDRTRSILGFSATDGELLWRTEAPAPKVQPTRRRTDRSIATPATDGERVYAHLGAHGLMAVDFDGTLVWHRPLGTFDHATSSPFLFDGQVAIVQVLSSRKRGSMVTLYEAATGRVKWRARRTESFASGTPIAIQVGEQQQLVVSAEAVVRSYDVLSGIEIWQSRGTEQNALPTPVVGLGMVYVTSGPRGKILAIHPTGQGNVTRSHVAWKVLETGPVITSPLFYDGYLFVLDDAMGTLTCLDGSTGEQVWSRQIIDTRSGGFTSSPVLVAGKLFVTDVTGNTHIFTAGPEFDFQGTNRLGEEVRASPALSEGVWYFRTKRHLIAIGTP